MTVTDNVEPEAVDKDSMRMESKLEDEVYPDEPEGGTLELEEGTEVAKGSHIVPKGVAVEELKNYGGQKDLQNKCPEDVQTLLTEKGAFEVYEKFVTKIKEDRTTRNSLGKWKDAQFISVLDQFRDDSAHHGVRVALCKRRSGSGTYRWLEFIDVDQLDPNQYEPQFDVANFSGQVIKTVHTKLEFPKGVAVEQFKEWGGRKKLKERIPIHVEKMLTEHDLMNEYNQLIDHCLEAGCGSKLKNWKTDKLQEIMDTYKPIFAAKGVDAYVSTKEEYVSHGQYGGHTEHFRWIEFGM